MEGSSKIKQALWFEPQYEVSDAEIAIMDAYAPKTLVEFRRNPNSSIIHAIHFLPKELPCELLMNPFFDGWIREQKCEHRLGQDFPLLEHSRLTISNPGVLMILNGTPSNASCRSMLLLQPHTAPATLTTLTVDPLDVNSALPVNCMEARRVSLRQGLKFSVLADLLPDKLGQQVDVNLHPGLTVSTKNGASATSPFSVTRVVNIE